MSFLALLLVCLSLSMHACSGRHLRTKTPAIVANTFESDFAGKRTREPSISSRLESSITEELQAQGQDHQQEVGNKEMKGTVKNMVLITPSRENHLPKLTTVEIEERNIRFMSESSEAKHDDAKETVDSKDSDDNVEDVVVMDYAQPHRKPPIHNEKN